MTLLTSSILSAKVHGQEVRSSSGPQVAKDRHALGGRKGAVSETAGQKYSVLLCLHSMLTTLNSLTTAVTSNLVDVDFGVFFFAPSHPQANGLVMVGDNNTLVGLSSFFLEGLECFDITEWPNGSELGFRILINAACHSNGNE